MARSKDSGENAVGGIPRGTLRTKGIRVMSSNAETALNAYSSIQLFLAPTKALSRVRFGVVGYGYWGPNVLRNFCAQPGCRVKYVVEINPERQAYVRANFPQSEVANSVETILRDPEIDAVVVATPASSHYEFANQVLEAGKHTFVEKPLATSTQEADKLVKIAAESNKTLMVGHTFLYNAAVRYARELVATEQLGELYYIYSQRLNLGQVRSLSVSR